MTLRPFHEHPLLHDYSDHRGYGYRAEWYCRECDSEIKGPPWQINEGYVIACEPQLSSAQHSCAKRSGAQLSIARPSKAAGQTTGRLWRVYMRSQFDNPERVPLFESTRKT